jgi:hypothetical protein
MSTAAVHNLAGLYACRFFLGLVCLLQHPCPSRLSLIEIQTEAGMFPGIILQLSYWYRPDEIAVRLMWICKRLLYQDLSGNNVDRKQLHSETCLVFSVVCWLTASTRRREQEDCPAGNGMCHFSSTALITAPLTICLAGSSLLRESALSSCLLLCSVPCPTVCSITTSRRNHF